MRHKGLDEEEDGAAQDKVTSESGHRISEKNVVSELDNVVSTSNAKASRLVNAQGSSSTSNIPMKRVNPFTEAWNKAVRYEVEYL